MLHRFGQPLLAKMCLFRSSILVAALLIVSVNGRCAPRSISITYKADNGERISVFKMCGKKACGDPLLEILSGCTKIYCRKGSRCNTCFASLNAQSLPSLNGTLGVFFEGENAPFYNFSADWPTANSDWFASNGWIAGCEPRVACLSRGCNTIIDVAVTAQACYPTLYRELNALSIGDCVAGNTSLGVPAGEIFGTDCPSRPL